MSEVAVTDRLGRNLRIWSLARQNAGGLPILRGWHRRKRVSDFAFLPLVLVCSSVAGCRKESQKDIANSRGRLGRSREKQQIQKPKAITLVEGNERRPEGRKSVECTLVVLRTL